MRWFKKAFVAVLFLALLVLGILAMMDNAERVSLQLLGWRTPALSVYWWLVAAAALGMALGWLIALRTNLQLRYQARKARRDLEAAQHELARLRTGATRRD